MAFDCKRKSRIILITISRYSDYIKPGGTFCQIGMKPGHALLFLVSCTITAKREKESRYRNQASKLINMTGQNSLEGGL
jgi:hypothetical protein